MQPYLVRSVGLSCRDFGKRWIYVGLDLGERDWVVAWMKLWEAEDSKPKTKKFLGGGCYEGLLFWLLELRRANDCEVHVLYEVGRQGFELARRLRKNGIATDIVAVSRLSRTKNGKSGKSDGFDARRLMDMDWSAPGFPLVWVPSREQEAARNLLMWEDSLLRDLRRCRNQGLSILSRWCVAYGKGLSDRQYQNLLGRAEVQSAIGAIDVCRVESLWHREEYLRSELKRVLALVEVRMAKDAVVQKLLVWRGVGEKTARTLAWYVGDWTRFGSGRSFGAYCGLTSVHVQSGDQDKDVGISHAGRRILRQLLGQQVVCWLNFQPESGLIRGREALCGRGKMSRVVRAAVARRLAVALWNWVVKGEEIKGALRKK